MKLVSGEGGDKKYPLIKIAETTGWLTIQLRIKERMDMGKKLRDSHHKYP